MIPSRTSRLRGIIEGSLQMLPANNLHRLRGHLSKLQRNILTPVVNGQVTFPDRKSMESMAGLVEKSPNILIPTHRIHEYERQTNFHQLRLITSRSLPPPTLQVQQVQLSQSAKVSSKLRVHLFKNPDTSLNQLPRRLEGAEGSLAFRVHCEVERPQRIHHQLTPPIPVQFPEQWNHILFHSLMEGETISRRIVKPFLLPEHVIPVVLEPSILGNLLPNPDKLVIEPAQLLPVPLPPRLSNRPSLLPDPPVRLLQEPGHLLHRLLLTLVRRRHSTRKLLVLLRQL